MTFLLGSEYCIQSLSNDVSDIQSCIKDIIFKIGRINSISWKFPDKFACDLNIDEYLINYQYDLNDKETNQVSHVILLELIIDRICLLLQLHCQSIDNLITKDSHNSNSKKDINKVKMFSPCLGLTSKKHWNKFSQLIIYLDNINKEISQIRKMNKDLHLEIENLKNSKANECNNNNTNTDNVSKQASDWLKSLDNSNKNLLKGRQSIAGCISRDVTFKSSQTLDTAFRPCESCHISQTCLRESSSLLMKMLKDESQSSSLMKLQQELSSMDWLSDKILLQIKDGFTKDFDKVCKHFLTIRERETKTNKNLSDNQILCQQLKEMLENQKCALSLQEDTFSKEKEKLEIQRNDYLNLIEELRNQIKKLTNENDLNIANNKKEIFHINQKLLESQKLNEKFDQVCLSVSQFNVNASDPVEAVGLVQDKIKQQNDTITHLNSKIVNQKFINDNLTAAEIVYKEKEEKLVNRLQILTQQKHKVEEKIDILQDQLESTQASLQVIESQNRSMTMKLSDQETLIETITKSKNEFKTRIFELETEMKSLEKTLVGLKEEKQILLNYPDLNGHVEKIDSGNIEQDIQNQIKSNTARIKILSEQNHDLEVALKKLSQNSLTSINQYSSRVLNKPENCINESQLLPSSTSLRPSSKMSVKSNSSTTRIMQKQPPPSNRPHSKERSTSQNNIIQWTISNQKPSNINQTIVCETCGRQYQQKSDLDVHKEYCAGRRRKIDHK